MRHAKCIPCDWAAHTRLSGGRTEECDVSEGRGSETVRYCIPFSCRGAGVSSGKAFEGVGLPHPPQAHSSAVVWRRLSCRPVPARIRELRWFGRLWTAESWQPVARKFMRGEFRGGRARTPRAFRQSVLATGDHNRDHDTQRPPTHPSRRRHMKRPSRWPGRMQQPFPPCVEITDEREGGAAERF